MIYPFKIADLPAQAPAKVTTQEWNQNVVIKSKYPEKGVIKKTTLSSPAKEQKKVAKEEIWNLSKQARDFIQQRECANWPHLKSYRDHKQYSIWCGTKSYNWEIITADEAYRRFDIAVEWRLQGVKNDFPTYNNNQLIAMVSVLYNCPSLYKYVKRYGASKQAFMSHVYASGKKMWWLVKRRAIERDLFNKKY